MSNIEYKDFSLKIETLSPASLEYLVTYGLKQSLQDCIAGLAKKVTEGGADDATVEATIAAAMQKRFDAIVSGKVTVRSIGPRLRGMEKVMADYAEEMLKAAFSKAGHKWPSGKGSAEKIAELREKYIAKYHDQVENEAKRRMTQAEEVTEFDLSDLDL